MIEVKRGKENKSVLLEDDAMDQFMEQQKSLMQQLDYVGNYNI